MVTCNLKMGYGVKSISGSANLRFFPPGFHSTPSLTPIHLHIISSDLESPCLKHKKHWNSFTKIPEFYVPLDAVLESLGHKVPPIVIMKEENEQLLVRPYSFPIGPYRASACITKEVMERAVMSCPRCGCDIQGNTIPAAKNHIKICRG